MQGVALLLLRRPIRLLRTGGSARGTIIASEESLVTRSRGAPRTFHFPVIQFTTQKGERIIFTSDTGRPKAFVTGSAVRVLYDPAKPHDAVQATFKTLWFFPLITAMFGLPFLALGLIGLI